MCQEDKDAADDVNKFLAEELARACRFNKSHNCFSADLQAFRNSKHVDDAIKQGLKGLGTYAKVQEHEHVFKRVFLGSHRDSSASNISAGLTSFLLRRCCVSLSKWEA